MKLAGRPVNYMALIKLLYKADREALRRWGLPITTDKYVSMAKGPVTSHIYDRIKAGANCLPLEIMDIVEALGLSEEESARVTSSIDTRRAAFSLAL